MMMKSVYLDMDPGHDDVLALLVALTAFHVKGVTTVAGNQTVDKTYRNARRVLDLAHYEAISVHQGYAHPLFRPLVTASHVHGSSGLDGYRFHPRTREDEILDDAQMWLASEFLHEPDPITWIATGPLTNVAAFLMGNTHFIPHIERLAIMGGSLNKGNITPYAEFNFYVDPDAADWVLVSGIPIRLVGLDVTHKALLSPEALERFLTWGSEVGTMLHDIFTFYFDHEPDAGPGGAPVHDVLAVAAVAHPEFFSWQPMNIRVERCHDVHRGQVIVVPGSGVDDRGVEVAIDIDVDRFFSWMWEMLDPYSR
ncbi:nucleoside hydrolase [Sulfobacillus thermosulfidooxidans]|uniref:nucleoside hydrolase n=1 Tax=Sulfobacillus thermosulfidooxidans TaxID=28034 RepID=UPI0004271BC0|nr:nucleoside hydrolase [Sulfobacillus thermosulfidooxidans]